MTLAPRPGDGPNEAATDQQTETLKLPKSAAKIQGFIGIIAITVGNIAAIITHIDEIRQYVSNHLGTKWVYYIHSYLVYGASALFLVGYGSLTYWLYRNFVAYRSWKFKVTFYGVAAIVVGSPVLASYEFLFRPVEFSPLVKAQLNNYVDTLVSQQVEGGDDDGGIRFSQSAISNDAQVWTTAQCLVGLLQQDPVIVKKIAPSLQRAFNYLNRSRLKSPERGWGYLRSMNWGVTEIDAWVVLAYLYSLSENNAALIWSSSEYPDVIEKARAALDQLLKRHAASEKAMSSGMFLKLSSAGASKKVWLAARASPWTPP